MKRKKMFIAAILAAFVFFVPLISSAQVFMMDENQHLRDASGDWIVGIWGEAMPIVDYETGEEIYVPVGSGLWMLTAAAGLYLLTKKRKSRKTATAMLAACALTLGMTQCNKANDIANETTEGKTIFISLMAGDDGEKSDINVYNGKITWENGDKVYVVWNDALPNPLLLDGYLTAETGGNIQTKISGNVDIPTGYDITEANPHFTFYYVGNGVDFDPAASSSKMTFKIGEQDGINAGDYMIGRTDTVTMKKINDNSFGPKVDSPKTFRPLTSVLRLDVSQFGTAGESVVMSAKKVRNTMIINLENDGGITPSYDDTDEPSLRKITFNCFADSRISVMEAEVTAPNDTVNLNFKYKSKKGNIGIKNGIERGKIYAKVVENWSYPIPVEVITPGGDAYTDPFIGEEWMPAYLTGEFSVDDSGTKVRFSKGNLQYRASTNTWRFAEHQYDYVGGKNSSSGVEYGNVYYTAGGERKKASNGDISPTYEGWIDLFGWGTSNHNYGPTHYRPWDYDGNGNTYGPSGDLSVEGQSDWACNTIIAADGSETMMGWKTLTKDQWKYVLNQRTSSQTSEIGTLGKVRCAKVRIIIDGSYNLGVLIFPDVFQWPAGMSTSLKAKSINDKVYSSTGESTNITLSDFEKLEAAGVAFLPITGFREGLTIKQIYNSPYLCYWTSSKDSNTQASPLIYMATGFNSTAEISNMKFQGQDRKLGYAVRLVMFED